MRLLVIWVLFLIFRSIMLKAETSNGDLQLRSRYAKWQERYNRSYEDNREWEYRLGVYKSNVEYIEYVNSQNLSYKLVDNKFADMTIQEFRLTYASCVVSDLTTKGNLTRNKSKLKAPPAEVDWRKSGAVNPIMNQGQCGSCWATSTVAAVEGIHQIKTGKLVVVSSQQLVDCNTPENGGCNGGVPEKAYEYIIGNGGISTAADYPYTGVSKKCDATKEGIKAVTIAGYERVAKNDEKALQVAVAAQPVQLSIRAGSMAIQFYAAGVFSGPCGLTIDHGVTAVGYGTEKKDSFWIMRNSWGEDWGEKGYIRMLRGNGVPQGTCGLLFNPTYPVKEI